MKIINDFYLDGNKTLLQKESKKNVYLAIVGSRTILNYTEIVLKDFFEEISDYKNIVIVSGGMYGADLISHNLALNYGLPTVVFLPCGIKNYKNSQLFKNLKIKSDSNYLLVSNYPDQFPSRKYTYLQRNRQLVDFSDVVLVAQSGIKSGSIYSGHYALNQNKKTYCIPISLTNSQFLGNNILISKGASIYLNPKSILSELGVITNQSIDKRVIFESLPINLEDLGKVLSDQDINLIEKTVLELILKGEIFLKDGKFYKNGK